MYLNKNARTGNGGERSQIEVEEIKVVGALGIQSTTGNSTLRSNGVFLTLTNGDGHRGGMY